MKKLLLALGLIGTLIAGGLVSAQTLDIGFDDSSFDYSDDDIDEAFVDIGYEDGMLLVTFSSDAMISGLPSVELDDAQVPGYSEGYDADDNFFYIYEPDIANTFDVVDLDYRGREFQAVQFTHTDVNFASVFDNYNAKLTALGFTHNAEQESPSNLVYVYERGETEQIRVIFTRLGNDVSVRLATN